MVQGLQHSIWSNKMKTWMLIFLLPLFLGLALFGVFYLNSGDSKQYDEYGNLIAYKEVSSQERLMVAEQETGEILVVL